MAYTPNPDREIKGGKAVVSAQELADFKEKFGKDKTLRDLLNADKGLQRKLVIPKAMRNLPNNENDPNLEDKTSSLMDTFKIPSRDYAKEASIKTDAMRNASREDFKQGLKSYADYAEDIAAAKKMSSGGKVSSASSRGDGIAQRGKTRGKIVMCGGGMTKGKR